MRFQESLEPLRYTYEGQQRTAELERLLNDTGTTAFIVIRDDVILYERYFNEYNRDSLNTSASVSKSIVSILVGMAIADGLINSIDDPVVRYIPELENKGVENLTIRHLLTMSSGLKHTWGMTPWHDLVRSYYKPDLRRLALRVQVIEEPDRHYNYNNCHTQLLGIILERVTGASVSEYLERKIWVPLGMEYPASWCLDSRKHGFEQMMSGLNARAIDYAKIGRLYLNEGVWEGREIVPSQWVRRTTAPVPALQGIPDYYAGEEEEVVVDFFNDGGYYSHHWWGYQINEDAYDFFALGIIGQFIYVCPEKRMIIVRMSEDWGEVDWWPAVLRDLAWVFDY
jgi:CubicO group peptidase (beta-lactamase class C family)